MEKIGARVRQRALTGTEASTIGFLLVGYIGAFAFVGYAAVGNLREYWIGTRARRRAHGESWPGALVRLVRGNRNPDVDRFLVVD